MDCLVPVHERLTGGIRLDREGKWQAGPSHHDLHHANPNAAPHLAELVPWHRGVEAKYVGR